MIKTLLLLFFCFSLNSNQILANSDFEDSINLSTVVEMPYERFIALGNCCVTRYQINNHLSKRFDKDIHSFGGGQLFDWLIIHDYNKFAEALENNLSDFFERSNL